MTRLLTIKDIEIMYDISPTNLGQIRSPKNGYGFPAPVENTNPRNRLKKFDEQKVDEFFAKNNIRKGVNYRKQSDKKPKTIDLLLQFYKRNFPEKLHGCGDTVTLKIRPDEEGHWDYEHQRGCFTRSGGITSMYSEGM